MRARGMAAVAGAFLSWTVVACGQASSSGGGPALAASISDQFGDTLNLKPLAEVNPRPGAGRVNVIVLPEDASVEVDDIPHRRRDGVIELFGNAGESHWIRWVKGSRLCEQPVIIPASDAPPPRLDLKTCPAPRLGARGGVSSSRPAAPPGSVAPAAPSASSPLSNENE